MCDSPPLRCSRGSAIPTRQADPLSRAWIPIASCSRALVFSPIGLMDLHVQVISDRIPIPCRTLWRSSCLFCVNQFVLYWELPLHKPGPFKRHCLSVKYYVLAVTASSIFFGMLDAIWAQKSPVLCAWSLCILRIDQWLESEDNEKEENEIKSTIPTTPKAQQKLATKNYT